MEGETPMKLRTQTSAKLSDTANMGELPGIHQIHFAFDFELTFGHCAFRNLGQVFPNPTCSYVASDAVTGQDFMSSERLTTH